MSDVPVVRQPFGGAVASDGRTRSALVQLVDRIDGLAGQVASLEVASAPAKRRVGQLREHIARHVRPRALSLDAPLLVLLVGPTGAGKSSLFNALLGRPASQTGVLRPTTRELVVLARPADGDALVRFGGPLAGIDQGRLRLMRDEDAPEGLVLVDAPDVDSVEHSNRELTDRLVEAADLAVFVTTAIRYADRVPWEVLGRVRDRGLPLVVVVNRMPSDAGERQEVLEDLQRLLGDAGLVGGLGGVAVELIGVPEGSIDPETDGLRRDTVGPLLERIDGLASSREARLELASYALAGALAGLEPHLRTV
ncbi:MAG: 50S ribosome-binding GTPase, partial [Chloroflexota bacterium]|nr:50S ribosome-binding GTPase [Chloroflexota bacterium]